MNRKYLTEEQERDIQKYIELINSKDPEVIDLGISLFYNDYKNTIPLFLNSPYKIRTPEYIKSISAPNDGIEQAYWVSICFDLINFGYIVNDT